MWPLGLGPVEKIAERHGHELADAVELLVRAGGRAADRLEERAPRPHRSPARRRAVGDVHPRPVLRLAAAPPEEAEVQRPERRFLPGVLLVELVLPRLDSRLEDEAGGVAEALGIVAVPRLDAPEVEQLRHARGRRREGSGREAALLVEL